MYADVNYYKIEYGGTVISTEALATHLSRASDQIDALTYNRIRAAGGSTTFPATSRSV